MKLFTQLAAAVVAVVTLGFLASACAPAKKKNVPVGDQLTTGLRPAWKLTSLDGHELSPETLKGKVVVVDFWATWCGPCLMEIPGYIEMQKKYGKDGLVIIGASVDQAGPAQVKKFVEKNGMNYAVALADAETVEAFGGFSAIPTTFILNREGHIVHKKTGAMDHAAYEAIVQQVLWDVGNRG